MQRQRGGDNPTGDGSPTRSRSNRPITRTRQDASSIVDQAVEHSGQDIEPKEEIDTSILIPSGLTLLNCACSDNYRGAFARGRIVTIPGGSIGGKTVFCLTLLAEVCTNKRFDDYRLVYDDGEETMESFNIPYLFGGLAERLEAPFYDDNDIPIHSNTMQDFKARLLELTKKEDPFIYILDSLDALTTDEELKREYQNALVNAKSDDAVKELKDSYKTEKAKATTEALRMINGHLKKTKSVLIIIQQFRANIGALPFEKQWTTSGGKAPFFYSTHQIAMTRIKTHNPQIKNIKRKIGTRAKLELIKNKVTGKERTIEIDIFTDYGMDDIGSCVDMLVDAKVWDKSGTSIIPNDLFGSDYDGEKFSRKDLLKIIHNEKAIPEMQALVGKAWVEVEEMFRTDRPGRYR